MLTAQPAKFISFVWYLYNHNPKEAKEVLEACKEINRKNNTSHNRTKSSEKT